jgi:hypothetical protein
MTRETILQNCIAAMRKRLVSESARVAGFLDRNLWVMLGWWAVLTLLFGAIRLTALIVAHPQLARIALITDLILSYALIAASPLAAYALIARSFPKGKLPAQPALRLCHFGKWSSVSPSEARDRPEFGMSGLLVSLVAGLVLSISMRMIEYFLAMPAVPYMAPDWAVAMFRLMTFDLVLFAFLYTICIGMALRAAPLFPRMLCYTWACDLLMQLAIARHMAGIAGLPSDVAQALEPYVLVNIKKTLISVMIWLPYLIVSNRVNLRFRLRVRFERATAATA